MGSFKRAYAKTFLDCYCWSYGEPLQTCTSTEDPPALAGSFGSVSCGVTAPFLWVSWCVQILSVPSKTGVCFPQYCGSPLIKSCWSSRSDVMGIPSPFASSSGWEAWCSVQNLHNSRRTSLVLLFSSLWVTYLAGIGFDFIVISPLLLSHCGFFFVFECGVSFFGGFQHSPVNGCWAASCGFGALSGRDARMSFDPTTLEF